MVPWKRPADLLQAAAGIDGLYVIYAGDGILRAHVEREAQELGIDRRVRFLGFVNQQGLPAIYAASDVLVLPSEHEAFGLVVNEAFACGCPAIVSDACGCVGDLVRDGETGFVVPVGDVAALAGRLEVLVTQPERRRAMGDRARARIAEWGPDQHAKAFVDACVELAARRIPPVTRGAA